MEQKPSLTKAMRGPSASTAGVRMAIPCPATRTALPRRRNWSLSSRCSVSLRSSRDSSTEAAVVHAVRSEVTSSDITKVAILFEKIRPKMIVGYATTLLPGKLHASRVFRRIEERLRVRLVLQVRVPEHQRDRSNRAERAAVADRPAAVVVLRNVVENLSGARIDDRRFAGAV